jgi:preprotein translocase subunit SecA
LIPIGDALTKVFGTSNDRMVKRMSSTVAQINAMEPQMRQMLDEQMRAKTHEFRARIAARIADVADADERYDREQDELDKILPEAFALVREAGRRVINMRHFDVQLIGGAVLHRGNIAEMKTGEGKTLVATLPCYLNALAGHGVHVVTVNDYLAKRDAEWMGKIHNFLGLSVGVIVHDLDDEQRRAAYAADITYGTNNEYGFDYLRDNMKFELSECVQRPVYYAIVDEVDSILIDEARTPLIISGPTDQTTDKYARVVRIIPQLELGEEIEESLDSKILTGDYVVDEKHRTIGVTDEGWVKIEGLLGIESIADPENWDLKHYVETAIKAHALYKRDDHYVVKDGEIIIVDEFTGRLMPGRRWSDGLHQSIEAKEGVNIRREDQTLATITFQNYFRLYKKLAGMTGTADTEAAEFEKIYKLEVVVIPTNMPMRRIDNTDVVFRTMKEKYFAVADEIAQLHENKQPVLVGTTSIEKSELLSQILQRKNVRHVVLNAKFHEREAEIVAQAGHLGMVTISTNMAGRGTDIVLGGNAEFLARQELVKKNRARAVSAAEGEIAPTAGAGMLRFYYQGQEFETPDADWNEVYAGYAAQAAQNREEVLAAGGLIIIGTERHESRRVDNQLRGRAGRQGDPGASRFFLSLEDDLMRIFAKEWVSNLLQRLGMEEGVPIESKLISRRIEAAQKAVEGQNFESRKHVLEYDDVMNKQREAVYGTRRQLLEGLDQKELVTDDFVSNILSTILDKHAPDKMHPDQWDAKAIQDAVLMQFGLDIAAENVKIAELNRHDLGETLFERLKERYEAKEQIIGPDAMRYHERMIMLSVLDGLWKDHLLAMDQLKEGIGLRGYGQQDPLISYKRESFEAFEAMMTRFQEDTVRFLFRMQIMGPDGQEISIPAHPRAQEGVVFSGGSANATEPTNVLQAGASVATALRGSASNGGSPNGGSANGVAQKIAVPTRAASTTIDSLEEEFQRRKKRELQQARMAGSGDSSETVQRRSGEKVGRNDPCPCGSGKKFKKCHGTEAS